VRALLVEEGPMRFVTAVALAAVMLWVPVDGVAREISLYDSEGEAVAYIDLSSSSSSV
tara:strand:- start:1510 stop:1683 length:174 start_codon:yes stop_codon:yes gene_type:complete